MEQSGRPGTVHMTAEAAAQLHREGPVGAARPPLHPTEIKSKGTMLTAWYGLGCGIPPPTCLPLGFLSKPPVPQDSSAPPARRRRASMANIADQHVPPSQPSTGAGPEAAAAAAAAFARPAGRAKLRRSHSDLGPLPPHSAAPSVLSRLVGRSEVFLPRRHSIDNTDSTQQRQRQQAAPSLGSPGSPAPLPPPTDAPAGGAGPGRCDSMP